MNSGSSDYPLTVEKIVFLCSNFCTRIIMCACNVVVCSNIGDTAFRSLLLHRHHPHNLHGSTCYNCTIATLYQCPHPPGRSRNRRKLLSLHARLLCLPFLQLYVSGFFFLLLLNYSLLLTPFLLLCYSFLFLLFL